MCCFNQTILRIQIGAACAKGQLLFHPTVKTNKVTTWYLTKWSWKAISAVYWWPRYLFPILYTLPFLVYSLHWGSVSRCIIVCWQYGHTIVWMSHSQHDKTRDYIPIYMCLMWFLRVLPFFSWDHGQTFGPESVMHFGGQVQRVVRLGVIQFGGHGAEKWCNLEDDGE